MSMATKNLLQNKSMSRFCKNILLAKTDVGKVKATNRILPPSNWCYGRDFGRDPEGAGQGRTSGH